MVLSCDFLFKKLLKMFKNVIALIDIRKKIGSDFSWIDLANGHLFMRYKEWVKWKCRPWISNGKKLFGAGYILNQVLNLLISTWYMTAAALKTQIIWFGTFERFYSHLTNMRILNKFHFYFQMYCLSRIVFSNLPKISRIKLE